MKAECKHEWPVVIKFKVPGVPTEGFGIPQDVNCTHCGTPTQCQVGGLLMVRLTDDRLCAASYLGVDKAGSRLASIRAAYVPSQAAEGYPSSVSTADVCRMVNPSAEPSDLAGDLNIADRIILRVGDGLWEDRGSVGEFVDQEGWTTS